MNMYNIEILIFNLKLRKKILIIKRMIKSSIKKMNLYRNLFDSLVIFILDVMIIDAIINMMIIISVTAIAIILIMFYMETITFTNVVLLTLTILLIFRYILNDLESQINRM